MAIQRIQGSIFRSSDNIVVDVLTDLRALADERLEGIVHVLGRISVGDGGGGFFRYDSGSVVADNGVLNISPDVGSGSWVRVQEGGFASPYWFGFALDDDPDFATELVAQDTWAENLTIHYGRAVFIYKHGTADAAPNVYNGWVRITDNYQQLDLVMNSNKITNLAAGDTGTTEAANVLQVENLLATSRTYIEIPLPLQGAPATYDFGTDLTGAYIHVHDLSGQDRGRLSLAANEYAFESNDPTLGRVVLPDGYSEGWLVAYGFEGVSVAPNPGILHKVLDPGVDSPYELGASDIDTTLHIRGSGDFTINIPDDIAYHDIFSCLVHADLDAVDTLQIVPTGTATLTEISGYDKVIPENGWVAILGDASSAPNAYHLTGDTKP